MITCFIITECWSDWDEENRNRAAYLHDAKPWIF
jgi:hypothetical protein